MKKSESYRPNIILIITDCLRWDSFSQMNVKKEFDLILPHVYSVAPSTFFSIPSLMTATLPFEVVKNAMIPPNFPFYLPLVLHKTGYKIVWITGNIVTSKYFGYTRDYFSFYEDFTYKKQTDITLLEKSIKRSASYNSFSFKQKLKEKLKSNYPTLFKLISQNIKILRAAKNRLGFSKLYEDQNSAFAAKVRSEEILNIFSTLLDNGVEQPIFAFLHLMDTHAPYGPPSLGRKRLSKIEKLMRKLNYHPQKLNPSEISTIKELYQMEVQYMDHSLKALLRLIWDNLGYENTVVILISDHGEMLGENGYFTHPGDLLTDELLHVPLAIVGEPAKSLKIDRVGLYSSLILDRLISAILFDSGSRIQKDSVTLSIGYHRLEFGKYFPTKIAIRTETQKIISDITEELETQKKFVAYLKQRRKKILSARLKLDYSQFYKEMTYISQDVSEINLI